MVLMISVHDWLLVCWSRGGCVANELDELRQAGPGSQHIVVVQEMGISVPLFFVVFLSDHLFSGSARDRPDRGAAFPDGGARG